MPMLAEVISSHDRIYVRRGFDGTEDKRILKRNDAVATDQCRIAIAINTHYPDILNGFYVNTRIFRVIVSVFGECNLHVANVEYAREDGVVPIEDGSSLNEQEKYVILNQNQKIVGEIMLWGYYWGGYPEFYRDHLIVDAIIPINSYEMFINVLERFCRENEIKIEQYGTAITQKKRGVFKKIAHMVHKINRS